MTDEKALTLLNCMATNLVGDVQNGNKLATNYYDALCVAINILQKEQKREQSCEYCCDYTLNDSQFYDVEGEMGARFNFCPMCGRKLNARID